MQLILEWLGFKPTFDRFVMRLLRGLPPQLAHEWVCDKAAQSLANADGTKVSLTNMFLEYGNAKASTRGNLIRKYADTIASIGREIPSLWVAAARNVLPVVRSSYVCTTIEIGCRDRPNTLEPFVSFPLAGDLQVCLVYDFGNSMTYVKMSQLETWGQSADDARKRASANLAGLTTPGWVDSGKGWFSLASPDSYEESMLQLDSVLCALPFEGHAVFSPCNRGVLLAADERSASAVEAMMREAIRCAHEHPWPISGTLFVRRGGCWDAWVPDGPASVLAHELWSLHRGQDYEAQKEALEAFHERVGRDVFVASYGMLRKDSEVFSYATWTRGVVTLLPETDWVAMIFDFRSGKDMVRKLVRWTDMLQVCGHRLQATIESPIRYLVDSFPDELEWAALPDLNIG